MATRPLTPEEKTDLPIFNLGMHAATASIGPPFRFPDINITYFPLAADYEILNNFCDRYLNIAPDFAYFRPAAPMVLLSSVYYGHASSSGIAAWTSDNELLFGVPIEWWQPQGEGKKMVYQGTAIFAPFIWVDSLAAQIEGREVFGWPKQQGWLVGQQSAWTRNPLNDLNILQMNAEVFDESVVDSEQTPSPVIRIFEEAVPSLLKFPPNPFESLANSAKIAARQYTNLFDTTSWLGSMGRTASMMSPNLQQLRSLTQMMGSSALTNTINLKQFRDGQIPGVACYQSITNAVMETNQLTGSGLLGENALLQGDWSGGYRIDIVSHSSLPVVETLGLKAESQSVTSDGLVYSFRPVLPFWMTAHMVYKGGENIAWRFRDSGVARWRDNEKIEVLKETTFDEHGPAYLELGAQAFQVMKGPFSINNASVRVMPLLADKNTLQKFLNDTSTRDFESFFGQVPTNKAYFEPWGDMVFLVATVFNEHSIADNLGLWSETQVEFVIPVKATLEDKTTKFGWVAPFMYTSSSLGVTTGRELNGWRMLEAEMIRPPNEWVNNAEKNKKSESLLEMKMVLPTSTAGRTMSSTLVEIVSGQVQHSLDDSSKMQRQAYTLDLKTHVTSMAAQSLKSKSKDKDWERTEEFQGAVKGAKKYLDNSQPLNQYSFKQFRDAEQPDFACYQALTNTPLELKILNVQESEEPLHVHIYQFSTQPIVDMLGLKVKSTHKDEKGIYDAVQAVRPFSFTANGKADVGIDMIWRTNAKHWLDNDDVMRNLIPASRIPGHSADPNASTTTDSALTDDDEPGGLRTTEPQMIVNSMLSDGWYSVRKPNVDGVLPDYVLNVEHYGDIDSNIFPNRERVGGCPNLWAPYDVEPLAPLAMKKTKPRAKRKTKPKSPGK